MIWNNLTSEDQLESLINESEITPILIFKHSTRCSISSMVKDRLERAWNSNKNIRPYYLDLIRFREVSNLVARKLNVEHQSPQAILLKNREVHYNASHMSISIDKAFDSISD